MLRRDETNAAGDNSAISDAFETTIYSLWDVEAHSSTLEIMLRLAKLLTAGTGSIHDKGRNVK